jgi:flagellar biosynthesis protein FlhB
MKSLTQLKEDRGVAGLDILLSVIVMLFTIGFLVMIFSLMGGELIDQVQSDVTNNETAVEVINDTSTEIANVTDWFGIIIVITAMVVLILLTVIIISAIRGSGMVASA